MNSTPLLPAYFDETLAGLGLPEIIALMIRDEDRVPRNVIDECARRGEQSVERFAQLLDAEPGPESETAQGEWWLQLHAIMILGLIPTERAGLLLVKFMRQMALDDDQNLQDWFAGNWPALFRNKPANVVPALRTICEDRSLDWYVRANAMEPVVELALARGEQTLEDELAWVARIAADENEDWDTRMPAGNLLLNFPRDKYRPLVENLAKRQTGFFAYFGMEDVRSAYSAAQDEPNWLRRHNPWKFYEPVAIESRQQRWAEEDARAAERERAGDRDDEFSSEDDDSDLIPETYLRGGPKVGRNDPCPCGSGKKYKKCCLSDGV
jgi:hypothetical protein